MKKTMRIVHVTTTDYGGAYIAARRISNCLKTEEVDSKIVIRTKTKKDDENREIIHGCVKKLISKAKNLFNLLLSDEVITIDFCGTNICSCNEIREADVIVLHWVNSFISLHVIEKLIALDKPVIWVLHDMWPFTGGCHYDMECKQYEKDCKNCEMAKRTITKNLAEYSKNRKNKMLGKENVTFVGPSRWITECARKSFGNRLHIEHIPNPIDTDLFRPGNAKRTIRERYGLSPDLPLVLFAAMDISDRRKGFDLLCEAFDGLKSNIQLCVLGKKDNCFYNNCTYLGLIEDEYEMIDMYSMSDVFVIPSRQDNLSNSVLEAMSCGVPVTAFDIGGMSEMIIHKENGYLATAFCPEDLKNGIIYCINNASVLGKTARKTVIERFDKKVIASKYRELFRKL